MKKIFITLLLTSSTLVLADSSLLKKQAQELSENTSHLALTSAMGRSSLVMTCDHFKRLNIRSSIENLDYKSFEPKGLGKEKKKKEVSGEQASLLSEALVIENLCPLFVKDKDDNDIKGELSDAFLRLTEHSKSFLALVMESK